MADARWRPRVDPWVWWSAGEIATAASVPADTVRWHWPHLADALAAVDLWEKPVAAALIGTVAIETASKFEPVREAFWLSEAWRRTNLRYFPWYGRGDIQLTWESNYRAVGAALAELWGHTIPATCLLDDPEKALDPWVSAAVATLYFRDHGRQDGVGIPEAARAGDWPEVRRLVQGGSAGLDRLVQIATALLRTRPSALALSDVVERGRSRSGDPYVWDGETPGAFDCSGFVRWCYGGRVRSFTDWIFDDTVPLDTPAPGDVVLYEYADSAQPGVRFPHVGLWLSDGETLDARFGFGVGSHPHVAGARQCYRRVPGVVVDTVGPAADDPNERRRIFLHHLTGRVADAVRDQAGVVEQIQSAMTLPPSLPSRATTAQLAERLAAVEQVVHDTHARLDDVTRELGNIERELRRHRDRDA